MRTRLRKDERRVCHYCGSGETQKGKPLEGPYCSPTCKSNAAWHRSRTNNHGGIVDSAGESDDQLDRFGLYNPFKQYFD